MRLRVLVMLLKNSVGWLLWVEDWFMCDMVVEV